MATVIGVRYKYRRVCEHRRNGEAGKVQLESDLRPSRRDNGNMGDLSPLRLHGSLAFLCVLHPELPQRWEALVPGCRPQAGELHSRDVSMDRLLIRIVIFI